MRVTESVRYRGKQTQEVRERDRDRKTGEIEGERVKEIVRITERGNDK